MSLKRYWRFVHQQGITPSMDLMQQKQLQLANMLAFALFVTALCAVPAYLYNRMPVASFLCFYTIGYAGISWWLNGRGRQIAGRLVLIVGASSMIYTTLTFTITTPESIISNANLAFYIPFVTLVLLHIRKERKLLIAVLIYHTAVFLVIDPFLFYKAQPSAKEVFDPFLYYTDYKMIQIAAYLTIVSMLLFLKQVNYWAEQGLNESRAELAVANEELKTYNEAINAQREQLQAQHEAITASITYAQGIQKAMLPLAETLARYLPEHFVLWLPRDVVSGDFYWVEQVEGTTFLAVADCTGHGVPGALMSMMGANALNHLITHPENRSPGILLDKLSATIRHSLQQISTGNRDGMNMTLVAINHNTHTLTFAGAVNPLVYVQEGELHRIKGDFQPIGGKQFEEGARYTEHTVPLNSTTMVYLFSDGFHDQLGGPQEKKFQSRKFRELLHDGHALSMAAQQEKLQASHERWKGHVEQTDDVLVLGFRL